MATNDLWVEPHQLDPELDLATIDPGDEEALANYEAALQACQAASQLLWSLSGRKYHTGQVATELYLKDRSYLPLYNLRPYPGSYVVDRFGVFVISGLDYTSNRIHLAGRPVHAIASITDISTGETLDPDTYSVVNHNWVQFNTIPMEGVDISYSYGAPPPALGRMAALQLAKQFYLVWTGREDECELPERVTSVTRQGVSWVLMDNQQYLDDLRTGIYIVDMFLRSVNPGKATQKAKIFSVDMPRGRRKSG